MHGLMVVLERTKGEGGGRASKVVRLGRRTNTGPGDLRGRRSRKKLLKKGELLTALEKGGRRVVFLDEGTPGGGGREAVDGQRVTKGPGGRT